MNRRKLYAGIAPGLILFVILGILIWRDSIAPPHVRIVGGHIFRRVYKPEPGYTWIADVPTRSDLRVKWTPGMAMEGTPHIIAGTEEGRLIPSVGYNWVDNVTPNDFRVQWVPGSRSSQFPHTFAGSIEGTFRHDPGYDWVTTTSGDFRVKWVPGSASMQYLHIIAAQEEGSFLPMAGYNWVVQPPVAGDMRVVWIPGLRTAQYPHVVAAQEEDHFIPETGYIWVAQPPVAGDMRVAWVPGLRPAAYPHIAAASAEGFFTADPGYRFVSPDSLNVELIVPEGQQLGDSSDQASSSAGNQIDWGRALAKAAVILIADHYSQPKPDDSDLTTSVGKPALRLFRDGMKDSLKDEFRIK